MTEPQRTRVEYQRVLIDLEFEGEGKARTASGQSVSIQVSLWGYVLAPQPNDVSEPSVIEANYEVRRSDQPYDSATCKGSRKVKAVR